MIDSSFLSQVLIKSCHFYFHILNSIFSILLPVIWLLCLLFRISCQRPPYWLCFQPPAQVWGLTEIGFDWVCFFRLRLPVCCHNLLSYKTLRYFAHFKIGFVFSNSFSTPSAGLGANTDWVCLALNWVCFFAVSKPQKSS